MITEPAKVFARTFRGYQPSAVDAHIEMLTTKQRLLVTDVESLRARLGASADEVTALRQEVARLTDTSSSPPAVQQRMAKMLRQAVDEVAEMQADARAEADTLRSDAQTARDQLLAEAEQRADRDRAEALQAVDEARRRRITILEQLMGVYRELETVPAALDAAYENDKVSTA